MSGCLLIVWLSALVLLYRSLSAIDLGLTSQTPKCLANRHSPIAAPTFQPTDILSRKSRKPVVMLATSTAATEGVYNWHNKETIMPCR